MSKVFFVKNKPQGADMINLVLKYNRVFIGYPAWKNGIERNPEDIARAVYDMKRDDFTKSDLSDKLNKRQKNGTFRHVKYAKKVQPGDYVIVPRVGSGTCFIGKIESPFEIDVDLSRHKEYLRLRKEQNLDTTEVVNGQKIYSHLGDVIQSWKVESFQEVPFPLVPRWISYRLMHRSTIGWIRNKLNGQLNAYQTIDKIYNDEYQFDSSFTDNVEVIKKRLYERTTPDELEVMITSLMKLEYPNLLWTHTGGSGDGGADGLGMSQNRSNEIKSIIQSKWMSSNFKSIANELKERLDDSDSRYPSVIIATLLSNIDNFKESDNYSSIRWLDADDIANLLLKYPNSDFSIRLNIKSNQKPS